MKKEIRKRVAAGVLSAVMLCAAVPVTTAFTAGTATSVVSAAEDDGTTQIYGTGFEDGDVSAFTGRGGVETITATTEQAYSGSYSMCVKDRAKNWNGPQFLLDDKCEAGVQYTVSAVAKTEWYNSIKLSMEYTDGERHYSNLQAQTSNGDWATFSGIKFSFSEDVSKVYLYFECNDTATMYIDDFEVRTAPVYQIQKDIPSLKDVYANDFKIGTAVTTEELAPQSTKDLIAKHFNSITLGNELKPESILDKSATQASGSETEPVINLASARTILNYCRDNNIPVRGHVLVWHSQTPDWFFKEGFQDSGDWVSKDIMLQRMENYIKNVFAALEEEYPTVDFYAWDVVNEAWLDNGSPRTGGGQSENANYSGWVKVFGDNSFIEPAFEYARKYAPKNTKLYYNDFNEYMPQKTDAICKMALELKEKGLIDGIGMQSHLDVGFPTVSAYKKALAKFAETGLDIQVTELDITTSDTSEAGFEKQAEMYKGIMDACVEYADSISAVVFWGTTDDKSWRAAKSPLLFNEDYTAKPAFYSIVEGKEPVVTTTSTSATTSETTTETTTVTTGTTPGDDVIRGDVNHDGMLNGFDLALMRQYLLNASADDRNLILDSSVDMNADNEFNIQDVVTMTKFLLGE